MCFFYFQGRGDGSSETSVAIYQATCRHIIADSNLHSHRLENLESRILLVKSEYNRTVYKLFTVFKKAYDSIRTEVLYTILTVFGIQ
jgi:hypothetical protein